ncbi:MAG: hypothetical protein HKO81_10185 [Flavobacteriaceae bacterium]|nr:hypothetical protein [Flavobacteriaceae bacterium]
MNKRSIFILFFALLIFSVSAEAQCAMCRAVLENEEGQNAAKGINDGIVYLMMIPYILIGGLGYIIYYKFFKTKKELK